MKKCTNLILFLFLAMGMAGCGIAPEAKRSLKIYDLGLASQPAKARPRIVLQDIVSPSWLATPAIHYRLLFHDASRLNAYADSRWAAPPAALLTLRMRQGLASQTGDGRIYQLRVELDEFSHLFDAPDSSRGLVRVRATLIRADEHKILASRTFSHEHKANAPDAEGGVHALNAASDELIVKIAAWLDEVDADQNARK